MDFIDIAKARYSVRKFSNKPIEKEKIELILEAGRVSPTAMNYQSQRILVVCLINQTIEAIFTINQITPRHY